MDGLIGRGIAAITYDYDNLFIWYFLNSIESKLDSQGTGTTFKAISGNILKSQTVSFPPLPIQRAIVAKIEVLFSSLDQGIADLKKAQAQLKIYRQAVLKKAFEGELTKNILSRDLNDLPDGHDAEVKGLGKLPKSWKSVKLKEIAETCLGKMLDKNKNTGILKEYIGNINVRWGYFDIEHLKKMRFEESGSNRFEIRKGDLIICEGGEPGRCAVWKQDKSVFFQKALHRVRFKDSHIPDYFYYFFVFQAANGGLNSYFTGTTIKHLTGRKLKEIIIPIPSGKEQIRIVREIESRLSVCDKVEECIKESFEKAQALRQSILKKAFEGALLSEKEIAKCKQEKDYEPASVLLDRIKKDKPIKA